MGWPENRTAKWNLEWKMGFVKEVLENGMENGKGHNGRSLVCTTTELWLTYKTPTKTLEDVPYWTLGFLSLFGSGLPCVLAQQLFLLLYLFAAPVE